MASRKINEVRVSKILIHPIKSCRGTAVSEARYTTEGLENDRRWCVIDAKTNTIVTAREVPTMVLVTPHIKSDPSSPYGGQLVVTFPEESGCETFTVPLNPTADVRRKWKVIDRCSLFDEAFIDGYVCESLSSSPSSPSATMSQYFGRAVLLVMKGPKPRSCPPTHAYPELKRRPSSRCVFLDRTMIPVSTVSCSGWLPALLASEESLAHVAQRVRQAAQKSKGEEGWVGGLETQRWRTGQLAIERFRPNIVVVGAGEPFVEDMWREAVLGDPATASSARTLTLVSKCARCLLPNVDTQTGVRDAAVPYKVLMKFRTGKDPARLNKACFGCNAMFGGDGVVRVGDRISVKTWAGAGGV
ncbi:MOSC N-terminal beta barrel domain-containing protein [Amylocystis lapponica]|nr:MOSC N-terminal beta barrel domain-containing protein [Amylocystis lapponica]